MTVVAVMGAETQTAQEPQLARASMTGEAAAVLAVAAVVVSIVVVVVSGEGTGAGIKNSSYVSTINLLD